MRCTFCGRENKDQYKFCLGCGEELKKPDAEKQSQYTGRVREQVAALLAEVADYEKFELWDDALRCMQRVIGLVPDQAEYKKKILALRAKQNGD
jgi:hypothetical protein